jgi:GH24 family phage-related lysozyme (muramidase)
MVKNVKYTSEIKEDMSGVCAEKLPGCEEKATVHVCFEDGSGESVCRSCFDRRVNDGDWITDSAEYLLAS